MKMTANVIALQPLVLGIVFGITGLWKLLVPRSQELVTHSALGAIFGSRAAQRIYQLVAVGEFGVATILLVVPGWAWASRMATARAASFVAYLLISMKVAPSRPCACVGRREVPITWRTIFRAGLICAFSILGWGARESWQATLVSHPAYLGIAGGQLLLLVAMSPEFTLLRSGSAPRPSSEPPTTTNEMDCASALVPMSKTLEQLHSSVAYAKLSDFLHADMLEHWREGCWRFLSFDARFEGRKATAVFAVPVSNEPHRVRGALVDETDGTILLAMDASAIEPPIAPVA
jgi:hypothetical protein